ncbi:hypothetical protein R1flu_012746 [Riccia fluitans]|uniref:Uncharacterized protein n=1 Tax=Riccia fluitans TaxID=41844 RepID=A0ABD1ZCM2_9MARC
MAEFEASQIEAEPTNSNECRGTYEGNGAETDERGSFRVSFRHRKCCLVFVCGVGVNQRTELHHRLPNDLDWIPDREDVMTEEISVGLYGERRCDSRQGGKIEADSGGTWCSQR